MFEDRVYHWFVSTYAYFNTSDSLVAALDAIRKRHPREPKLLVNVWRVPGRNVGTHYKVSFYAPQIEGAMFCGTTTLSEKYVVSAEGGIMSREEAYAERGVS